MSNKRVIQYVLVVFWKFHMTHLHSEKKLS